MKKIQKIKNENGLENKKIYIINKFLYVNSLRVKNIKIILGQI